VSYSVDALLEIPLAHDVALYRKMQCLVAAGAEGAGLARPGEQELVPAGKA
jgi:hypothetical protein